MTTLLYILFIASCVILIVSVLLQPGKADAGALFSSSVSSTAFGPRGTQTLLSKITIAAAALFMLVALALSLPFMTGQSSVLQRVGEETPTSSPQASPGASPAASPAEGGASPSQPPSTNAPAETGGAPAGSPVTGTTPAP